MRSGFSAEWLDVSCPSQTLWVGIGCRRGTLRTAIEQAIRAVFQANQLSEHAIAGIATLDTKANEAGLVEFCRDRNLPLYCFAADRLRSVAVPNPSGAIEAAVGTPSVAEAAALWASWEADVREQERQRAGAQETAEAQRRGDVAQSVTTPDGLYRKPYLCVAKQIFRMPGQPGSVAIAVARSPRTQSAG